VFWKTLLTAGYQDAETLLFAVFAVIPANPPEADKDGNAVPNMFFSNLLGISCAAREKA
jgi:Na+/H+-dicarboxylate symporter